MHVQAEADEDGDDSSKSEEMGFQGNFDKIVRWSALDFPSFECPPSYVS